MEHSLKPSECCVPALNCSESLGGNEPAGVEYLGPHFTSMKGQNHSVICCVICNVVGPRHKACLCGFNTACTLLLPLYCLFQRLTKRHVRAPSVVLCHFYIYVARHPLPSDHRSRQSDLGRSTSRASARNLLNAPCPEIISEYDCLSYPLSFR